MSPVWSLRVGFFQPEKLWRVPKGKQYILNLKGSGKGTAVKGSSKSSA